MAHLTLCDICKNPCQFGQRIELKGWYGKKLFQKGDRRNEDQYVTARIYDCEGVRADICIGCMQFHLKNISLHPVFNRKQLYKKRRREHPEEHGLKSLRLTAGYTIESVHCDNCQSDCYNKHLQLKANWLAPDDAELTAEFCEACVESRLKPIVSFQIVAAAPGESSAAVV